MFEKIMKMLLINFLFTIVATFILIFSGAIMIASRGYDFSLFELLFSFKFVSAIIFLTGIGLDIFSPKGVMKNV